MRRAPETKKAPRFEKSRAPGELVHSDLLGPLLTSLDGGYRYLAVFVDDFSRYIMVYPMREKGELEVQYARFEQDMSEYFISQRRQLHTDNGGEFMSKSLAEYLTTNEIKHTTSSPYSPNQNAIAEQAMWRLCSVARAMLLECGLPTCHWAMALTQAALRLNITPRRTIRAGSKIKGASPDPSDVAWTTPYERLKGRKPNVRFLRVFGCRAWVLNEPIQGRAKLESIATEGWCIGPARYSRGMVIYIPDSESPNDLTKGKYKITRNIRVDESFTPKGRVDSGPSLAPPIVAGSERPQAKDVILFRVPAKAKPGDVLDVTSPKTGRSVQIRVAERMYPETYWTAYDTTIPNADDAVFGTAQSIIDASADGADTGSTTAPSRGLPTEGVLVGGKSKQLKKISKRARNNAIKGGPVNSPSSDPTLPPTWVTAVPGGGAPGDDVTWATPVPPPRVTAVPGGPKGTDVTWASVAGRHDSQQPTPQASAEGVDGAQLVTANMTHTMRMHRTDFEELSEALEDGDEEAIEQFITKQKMLRGDDPDITYTVGIPPSCKSALTGPDKEKWMPSYTEELTALQQNKTFSVEDIPAGVHVIDPTVVRDVKRDENGRPDRWKTRVCARGFMQRLGEHYFNTFSNTVRYETLRLLMAIAAGNDLALTSLDIKTAYLNGYIEGGVQIYMRFPAGWHFEGDGFDYTFKYTGDHTRKRGRPERGLRLVKAIYGLKQSGALWEETLRSFLLSINAVQCVVDPCLWRYSKDGNTLLFVVYVDDIVIACSNQDFRDAFVSVLQERFTLRDNGPLTWVFGSAVEQDLEQGTVSFHQKLFIQDTVKEFLGDDPRPSKRAVPCNDDITNLTHLEEGEMMHPRYAEIVGKIGWLANISRPDIGYAYSMLSKFLKGGGERHFNIALGVLAYLDKTRDKTITYRREADGNLADHIVEHADLASFDYDRFVPIIFSDTSHGGEKPQAGYVIFVCNGPVSAHAGRLKSTPTSSSEGEYAIATKATQAAIAVSDTIKFMAEDLPDYKGNKSDLGCTMPLFCDNRAAVLLSEGNTSSKRMRHVATQIAFLREQVKDTKRVKLIHIRTQGQIADLFTKPLAAAVFHPLRAFVVA